jgi:ppGpp synthetase/RelA/SpoT-type nucleotidyltranferase
MDFETYCQSKQAEYAALAETVASILQAALKAYPGVFRLQQVQHRAKSPDSLKKKLEDRGIQSTTTLEADIKDLAGCRLIFYTNSDVSRFGQTGIIQDNFDVDWGRTKIHHPVPGSTDPDNLFISNNYVVKLKANRTSLPEYARFSDLACEVQIQTTLNHAWSEMEHDILYKKRTLEGFGGKLFEAIQLRLRTLMRTYLLPAGYEFQKVLDDYERLMSGKELFDRGALKALAECDDNNARLELLERFRDYVLPNYDDPVSVYPEIKENIVAAIKEARLAKPRMIETPFGNYPGATAERVVEVAAEILRHLRYVAIEITFDAICELFPSAQTDGERKHLLQLAEHLAQHNLDAWKQAGPIVQTILIQKIRDLPQGDIDRLRPVLLCVLGEALKTEVQGMSSTYNSMTLHSGSVLASDALTKLRTEALDVLMNLYRSAPSDVEKRNTEITIFQATALPTSAGYSKELLITVLNDSVRVVDLCREIASTGAYEILQKAEDRLLWLHRRTQQIQNDPKMDAATLAVAERLSESIRSFRDVAEANKRFVIYKTLVGFDSVFPPMWENENYDIAEEDAYRKERIDELVAEVNEGNADEWFATIQRCAQTDSSDLATFPSFGLFLQKLGRAQPLIVLRFIEQLDERLAGFLGIMLSGLAESDRRAEVSAKILQWVSEDRYLNQIAHYFRFAPQLDDAVLSKILDAGIRLKSDEIVGQVLATVFYRYKDETPDLIDGIIMPGIAYFSERRDARWVNHAWFLPKDSSPLVKLTAAQVDAVLKSLIYLPRIETHAERILGILADIYPERVFDFFGDRLKFSTERDDDGSYEAIPFHFYSLQQQFSGLADHAIDTVRRWFVSGDPLFQFTGGRLIASSFPNFPDALRQKLSSYVRLNVREEAEFVVRILSGYRGQPFLYETCKELVQSLPVDDSLLSNVQIILQTTGGVFGEFGFVEAHQTKREAMVPWLSDTDEKVRCFAERYIGLLDRQIAAEQRRSEEDIEMRKRGYDDPKDGEEDK